VLISLSRLSAVESSKDNGGNKSDETLKCARRQPVWERVTSLTVYHGDC
jgi:hypothetical protein